MNLQLFINQKRRELAKKKKLMKRKVCFLKVKIFLTCVLPVIIVLLAVKVIQTLVRIEIRKSAFNAAEKTIGNGNGSSKRTSVVQTTEKPEFVTPVPVGTVETAENNESHV